MTFSKSVSTCLKKYITFSGRGSRSEYWWFTLFVIVVTYGVSITELSIIGMPTSHFDYIRLVETYPLSTTVYLLFFLPSWTSIVRRLHDTERNGIWILINLIPIIGPIILFFWLIERGTHGSNIYGIDPLYAENAVPEISPEERMAYEQEKSASLRELRESRTNTDGLSTYKPTIRRD
ncbi:MAG: DUF805 domain-containing protein [Paracoccaceae bacterium]